MKGWKRIASVIFLLIGGTMFFGYWSINQFNQAFDNLSAPYLANARSASTSPEISGEFATSTSSWQATSTDDESR